MTITRSYTLIKTLSPPSSEVPLAFVTSLIMLSNSSEKQERSEQFALQRNLLNYTTRMPLEDLSSRIPRQNTEQIFTFI